MIAILTMLKDIKRGCEMTNLERQTRSLHFADGQPEIGVINDCIWEIELRGN
jgi:hypothetical protein